MSSVEEGLACSGSRSVLDSLQKRTGMSWGVRSTSVKKATVSVNKCLFPGGLVRDFGSRCNREVTSGPPLCPEEPKRNGDDDFKGFAKSGGMFRCEARLLLRKAIKRHVERRHTRERTPAPVGDAYQSRAVRGEKSVQRSGRSPRISDGLRSGSGARNGLQCDGRPRPRVKAHTIRSPDDASLRWKLERRSPCRSPNTEETKTFLRTRDRLSQGRHRRDKAPSGPWGRSSDAKNPLPPYPRMLFVSSFLLVIASLRRSTAFRKTRSEREVPESANTRACRRRLNLRSSFLSGSTGSPDERTATNRQWSIGGTFPDRRKFSRQKGRRRRVSSWSFRLSGSPRQHSFFCTFPYESRLRFETGVARSNFP